MRETGTLPRVDGTGDRLARTIRTLKFAEASHQALAFDEALRAAAEGPFFLPSQTPLNLCSLFR